MVRLLIELVSDANPHISARAAKQLAELGSDAVAAVPALIRLVQMPLGAQPNLEKAWFVVVRPTYRMVERPPSV
jgi:hypothetical protein